jgi:hypothetical protein
MDKKINEVKLGPAIFLGNEFLTDCLLNKYIKRKNYF